MPEIGPTLREARMSARIDITEVELATKIRAKYLRAIENEEWQLLPGSTFAKSFIRTYADYLGIDSRSLVEEYKLRYERPSETELRTATAPTRAASAAGEAVAARRAGR
jgi:cytoskeletal protein RodZ